VTWQEKLHEKVFLLPYQADIIDKHEDPQAAWEALTMAEDFFWIHGKLQIESNFTLALNAYRLLLPIWKTEDALSQKLIEDLSIYFFDPNEELERRIGEAVSKLICVTPSHDQYLFEYPGLTLPVFFQRDTLIHVVCCLMGERHQAFAALYYAARLPGYYAHEKTLVRGALGLWPRHPFGEFTS